MVEKNLPSVPFKKDSRNIDGFDIVKISDIAKTRAIDHHPDEPHLPDFYLLAYYTQGRSQHLVDFNWYDVSPGKLVYLTVDQVNAFQFTDGLEGYCLLFTKSFFEKSLRLFSKDMVHRLYSPDLYSPIVDLQDQSNFHTYFKLLAEEFTAGSADTIISSLFSIVLNKAELCREKRMFEQGEQQQLQVFLAFDNLVKGKFTQNRDATFYANELAISYKHLNVVCKQLVNKTAKQFIDEYIILEAKRKLMNSSVKSTELAYTLGFDEPTNFVKYFKNKTGFTPNEFKLKFS